MTVTDEQIAAFADGELSGDALREVEAAIAADPALDRKVQAHRALKSQLSAHFAPILDHPVPDHLSAMLRHSDDLAGEERGEDGPESGEVVSFAAERQKRGLAPMVRRWAPVAGPALAASLVLVLWQPWQGNDLPDGYAGTQLAAALDDQLVATQAAGSETRMLVSFENDSGEYCRAYRSGEEGGIACRDDTGWQVEQQFALGAAQSTEFQQAGSEADLLIAAQEMANGEALDADAETEAKERGWR